MPDWPPPRPLLRAGLRGTSAVLRAVGPLRYPLADVLGWASFALHPEERRRTASNHRRLGAGRTRAMRLALASHREYARTAIDFVWASGMNRQTLLRHTSFSGLEHVHDARAEGRGVVLALTHFGSWDIAGSIATAQGLPLTSVMAPVGSTAITQTVIWARQRAGLEIFTADRAVRGLLRALRANRCVALLCDVTEAGPTVEVRYCGGVVRFSAAPAWLALRTGAAIIPVDCCRVRGGYHATVHPPLQVGPGDDERELMQRIAVILEPAVRRCPAQWYPFGEVFENSAGPGRSA